MHMETRDGNAGETKDGSGSRNHFESNPEVSNSIGRTNIDSEGPMDLITECESGKQNNYSGSKSIVSSASSSTSPSSSSSLDYDFFQINTPNFIVSQASNPSSESAKSEVDDSPLGFKPIFQVFNETENQEEDMSPTESPPIQVMERSPVKLPSSIFERTGNPLDWSVASNDSLFSIHLDTASIPRRSTFTFDELGGMSGELRKTDELSLFNRTSSAIIEDIDTSINSVEVESPQGREASNEAACNVEEIPSEDHPPDLYLSADLNLAKNLVASVSHGSRTSMQSFTFPILTQEERKLSVKTDATKKQLQTPELDTTSYTISTFCDAFHSKQPSEVTSNSHHKQSNSHQKQAPEVVVPSIPLSKKASQVTSMPRSKKASQGTSKSTTKGCCYWFRCFYCPCIWKSCCTWKLCCSCRWKPSCKWKSCCFT